MVNVVIRLDEEGRYSWSRIESQYDNETLIGRSVFFDNGVESHTTYTNGVRARVIQVDNPGSDTGTGAERWDYIDSIYDENGDLAQRETRLDNGVAHYQEYTNGVIARSVLVDNPGVDGDGAKSWSMIDTQYDANGEVLEKHTVFDSGVERYDLFDSGALTRTVQIDNSSDGSGAAWSEIDTYYGPAGEIETRATTFDNGLIRYERFENGVRSSTYTTDNPYEEGPGVKAWDTISTMYDASGEVASKLVVYDDGRVRESTYEDGTIAHAVTRDNPLDENGGAHSWNQQEFIYDEAGQLASRQTEYDDGDMTLVTYVDGQIASRSEFDGDGDQSWLGRTTNFDAMGDVVSSQVYNSYSELPEDFFINPQMPEIIG